MIGIELGALAIVLVYLAVGFYRASEPRRFLQRMAALMAASWLAENGVIHLYGFYRYSEGWSLFIDRVPILIVAIWPVVIHSAWDLACGLARDPARVPLLAALIVLADASLIEPVAVRAGLWTWSEPGLFAVPPIGMLGWAFFAWLCVQVLERPRLSSVTLLGWGPLLVHPMLLASWWLALRWVNASIAPWPVVVVAWVVSLGLAIHIARTDIGKRLPLIELLLRVPAAGYFFVLLALHADGSAALSAYALAFAPPYLVLTARARRRAQAST